MKLQMVGCSHHNASLEVRERLAFSPAQAATALDMWRNRFPDTEAVLLSTCNRVEVYAAATDPVAVPSDQQVKQFLAEFHGLELHQVFDDLFEQSGEGAVRHLFTVAASIDSMVLGEPQILAQVKQAYQLAQQQQSVGPITHDIFQRALRVAKRVATETSINERRVSIPSVAVSDFARNVFERFDDKRILVIGAGEMADETLVYLREEGARGITVIGRNRESSQKLARQHGGTAAPWEQLEVELAAADVVISTTGAAQPVVTLDLFQPHRTAAAISDRCSFSIWPSRAISIPASAIAWACTCIPSTICKRFAAAIAPSATRSFHKRWPSSRKKPACSCTSYTIGRPARSSSSFAKAGTKCATKNFAGYSTSCPNWTSARNKKLRRPSIATSTSFCIRRWNRCVMNLAPASRTACSMP